MANHVQLQCSLVSYTDTDAAVDISRVTPTLGYLIQQVVVQKPPPGTRDGLHNSSGMQGGMRSERG